MRFSKVEQWTEEVSPTDFDYLLAELKGESGAEREREGGIGGSSQFFVFPPPDVEQLKATHEQMFTVQVRRTRGTNFNTGY